MASQNADTFKRILDEPDFQRTILDHYAARLYERLRAETDQLGRPKRRRAVLFSEQLRELVDPEVRLAKDRAQRFGSKLLMEWNDHRSAHAVPAA